MEELQKSCIGFGSRKLLAVEKRKTVKNLKNLLKAKEKYLKLIKKMFWENKFVGDRK